MTVATLITRFVSAGDGVTIDFSFNCKFYADAAVKAVVVDADGAETIPSYSIVNKVSDGNGGWSSATVRMVSAPASDAEVIRYLDPALTQETNFAGETNVLAALNRKSDLVETKLQRASDRASRSLRMADGDPETDMAALPHKSELATSLLGFDADGNPMAAAGSSGDVAVSTAMAPVVQAATTGAAAAAMHVAYTVATIADLALEPSADLVFVRGRSAAGDGGGGWFRWSGTTNLAAAATADAIKAVYVPRSTDLTGATGAYVRDVDLTAPMNPAHYGMAPGAGAIDTALQAMLNAADGRAIDLRIGQWNSQGASSFTVTESFTLQGHGNGAGSGPADISQTQASVLMKFDDRGDLFSCTDDNPFVFRDLQLNVWPDNRPQTKGALIKISGDAGNNTRSEISNCALLGGYRLVEMHVVGFPTQANCYYGDWVDAAIYGETTTLLEGSGGLISNPYFFGDTAVGTTQDSCVTMKTGYFTVTNGLVLGAKYGLKFTPKNFPAGRPGILGGSWEEQDVATVYGESEDGAIASMFEMANGEASIATNRPNFIGHIVLKQGAHAGWLESWDISNWIFRSLLKRAGSAYIDIDVGTGDISDCAFYAISPSDNAAVGIRIGATSGPVAVKNCRLVGFTGAAGSGTAPYSLHSNVTLVDLESGITVAQLPVCKDGSLVYCSDAKPGVTPAVGGGAGCLLRREGGVWCAFKKASKVELFTTSATWTKEEGAVSVKVEIVAPGGGGGGGARVASGSQCSGGAAGGGGSYATAVFAAADLSATETVTIGALGTGGNGATVDATAGSNGAAGGNTTFGTHLTGFGGGGGAGGQLAGNAGGGGGGGHVGAGGSSTSSAAGTAGNAGGGAGNASATWPQCGGGGGQATNAAAGSAGGSSIDGGPGGGSGGGIAAAPTAFTGGNYARSKGYYSAGGGGANPGGAGSSAADLKVGAGTGGGGGGSNTAGVGGRGGDAGYGGGGGGGGAAIGGNGGRGGDGGTSYVKITTSF